MRNWNWTPRAERIGYMLGVITFFIVLEFIERLLDVIL
jgi:hypothetical protein